MGRVSWKDKVTNADVLQRVRLIKSEASLILSDAGNIAGSDMFLGMMDDLLNDILEVKVIEKPPRGRNR